MPLKCSVTLELLDFQCSSSVTPVAASWNGNEDMAEDWALASAMSTAVGALAEGSVIDPFPIIGKVVSELEDHFLADRYLDFIMYARKAMGEFAKYEDMANATKRQ